MDQITKERLQRQRKIQIARTIFKPFLGKIQFQRFFEAFYGLSLLGLNFGTGDSVNHSGEICVLNYLQQKYKKNTDLIIFDVGANVGDYTKSVLSFFDNAHIFCFEPSKTTFEQLQKNVTKNENVTLNNFGLGKENKKAILFSNCQDLGLSSLYDRQLDHLGIKLSEREEVEIKKLDDYCSEKSLRNINLLKIDVEGNELDVLCGANEMLSNKLIDFIQFEFGGCNIDSRTYFRDFFYLLGSNYQIYRILQNGLYSIKNYNEINEVFITTNYLAQKKT